MKTIHKYTSNIRSNKKSFDEVERLCRKHVDVGSNQIVGFHEWGRQENVISPDSMMDAHQ